jgi:hypothetical protein
MTHYSETLAMHAAWTAWRDIHEMVFSIECEDLVAQRRVTSIATYYNSLESLKHSVRLSIAFPLTTI